MSTLYVDRKDMELRFNAGAIELREEGARVQSVPAALLKRVVVRGDVRLTTGTIAALAEQGVSLVVIAGRAGQRVAQTVGREANDARPRIAQCQRVRDEGFGTAWARVVLRAKVNSQRAFLLRAQRGRPDLRKPLADAIAALEVARENMREAGDRATLRGLEGAAAAAYFRGYTQLFAESLGFHGRRRRPPTDPVNACLSLGYTLLTAEATRACWAAGLDPCVGLLHLPAFGRPSMACDLVEPWRARVEEWVWAQFRDRWLRAEHFGTEPSGACLLAKAGRAKFYVSWTPVQRTLERSLRRHATRAARTLASHAQLPDLGADEEAES